MDVLVIDNYDSFVYNLVHYLKDLGASVRVVRNDAITINSIESYNNILISPGPGIPDEAGLIKPIIEQFAPEKNILGVCLGLQAICEVFGGRITNLNQVSHGISSPASIIVDDEPLFYGMNDKIEVGRYHSWVLSRDSFPPALEITSLDEDQNIMSARHRIYNVRGIQFHPESILTPQGKQMISNWLYYCG